MACTGNVCRSPMAEVLLAQAAQARSANLVVASAGTLALVGQPAARLAQEVVRSRGADLSKHRARQLTPELAWDYDLILVMDAEQRAAVQRIAPVARGKVRRLGESGGFDIPDPYGGPREAFEEALALIERGLRDLERVLCAVR